MPVEKDGGRGRRHPEPNLGALLVHGLGDELIRRADGNLSKVPPHARMCSKIARGDDKYRFADITMGRTMTVAAQWAYIAFGVALVFLLGVVFGLF